MATSLGLLGVVYSDSFQETSAYVSTSRAIFGYGSAFSATVSITNLVSNTGLVNTDITGVGTVRYGPAAAGYGGDKAIFGYGYNGAFQSMTNLVSAIGVVTGDVTGVGTARNSLAAAGYGGDKAIFGYGFNGVRLSITNRVSNAGVVSTDVTGVGTARSNLAAAGYGGDKAIFGYGFGDVLGAPTWLGTTHLVSNTGLVLAEVENVPTNRSELAAAGYGGDKAIFGYGYNGNLLSMTNLVSNTGVVTGNVTGVGTTRRLLAAASYGGDKAIFGYGFVGIGALSVVSMTNLVSNTGAVVADVTGVGTARHSPAAAGFAA